MRCLHIRYNNNPSNINTHNNHTMKKNLFILCMITFIAQSCCEKPIFIGHRGSLLGVENTEEAFINGAAHFGYQGLECDVKTTLDSQCVCWHDDHLQRAGIEEVLIPNITLDTLLSLTLTQTRKDVTYTATICTVDRYLEICKEYNVFPVVELKWATGINNNDMSLFPSLYALIEKHGLVEEAVILTSMQQSIEYIRTHYPQLTCQWLRHNVQEEDYAWCEQWNVTLSVPHTSVTEQVIARSQQMGKAVATWTVNEIADYERVIQLGCKYVTTDYLEIP